MSNSPAEKTLPLPPLLFLDPPDSRGGLGKIAAYRVTRILGRGGMGMLLRAEDENLRRPVAIKVMLPEVASSSRARARFLREARAIAALNHNNVVRVYQADEFNGHLFIAMELLQGESLEAHMRAVGRMPLQSVLLIGHQIACGLAAAHDVGIVHRDIKPANVWIESPTGNAKILDFGLAATVDDNLAQLTGSGALIGTPAFMSPEQARGQQATPQSDLFSLGSVLYTMTTGRPPFSGESLVLLLAAVVSTQPIAPNALNPQLPKRLVTLLACLHSKCPSKRPESAKWVAMELEAILADCKYSESKSNSKSSSVICEQVKRNSLGVSTLKRLRHVFAIIAMVLIGLAVILSIGLLDPKSERRESGSASDFQEQVTASAKRIVKPYGQNPSAETTESSEPKNMKLVWRNAQEFTNIIGMEFVRVNPGKLTLGSPHSEVGREEDEEQYVAVIDRPFFIGKHEVTQSQYVQVMRRNPSFFSRKGAGGEYLGGEDHNSFPVETVSWENAKEFCRRLSDLPEERESGRVYRLPTEAEWEYSCRCGSSESAPFFFQNPAQSASAFQANFKSDSPYGGAPQADRPWRATAVGSYAPNALGIYDMHGNVWEWCENDYVQSPDKSINGVIVGLRTGSRVVRGGSWWDEGRSCRAAQRNKLSSGARHNNVGMRVVCDVE
jgi:eukaryotic-like serine/threonine-protein kinase